MFYDHSSFEHETKEGGIINDATTMSSAVPQHVTVIQSSNPSKDQQIFETYFGFLVEREDEPQRDTSSPENIVLMRTHQCVVLLPVPPKSPSSSSNQSPFSIFVFEELTMTKARAATDTDTAAVDGLAKVEWQSGSISSKSGNPISVTIAKVILSTGHILIATTPLGWKTPSARAKVLQYAAVQQQPQERSSFGSKFFSSPGGKRRSFSSRSNTPSPELKPAFSNNSNDPPRPKSSPSASPTNSIHSSHSGVKNNNQQLFPSLDIRALTPSGAMTPFAANSQVEVPVESDLFVGHLIFIIRPNDPTSDPYWNERLFSKKKRRVIMHLQGKLKYIPTGPLYAGLEITQPMKLGLMASGLCNLILTFIQKFDSNLHYSFGDKEEKAHMTSTAECFFDQLVVTAPGETPPKVCTMF